MTGDDDGLFPTMTTELRRPAGPRAGYANVPNCDEAGDDEDDGKALDEALSVVGEFGAGQVLQYCLASLAWTAAAPMTLHSIYLTKAGDGWQREGAENGMMGHSGPPPCDGSAFSWLPFKHFSVTTQYDLVCSRAAYRTAIDMSFWIGFILFLNVSGALADRFGRRLVLVLVTASAGASMLCVSMARDWTSVAFFLALTGAFNAGIGPCAVLLAVESSGARLRGVLGLGQKLFWSTGVIASAWVAWHVQESDGWRVYTAAAAVPALVYAFTAAIALSESPRWLMTVGRHEEAEAVLAAMGRRNGTLVAKEGERHGGSTGADEKLILKKRGGKSSEQQTNVESLWTVLGHRRLRRYLLLNCYLWFTTSALYYGLNFLLSEGNIEGNFYFNVILYGGVELVGAIIAMMSVDVFGRRSLLLFFLAQASISLLFSGMTSSASLQRSAAILGKAGIAATFALIFLFSSEMFPTSVRSQSLGICSTFARVGSLTAPIISSSSRTSHVIPFVVFGLLGSMACLTSSFLPETLGKKLADTCDDVPQDQSTGNSAPQTTTAVTRPDSSRS